MTNAVDPQITGANPPLLSMRGMCKAFGGTRAVVGVDMDIYSGEVVALLGHNGAGKSTLIKLLAGVYGMDAGQILLDGEPFDPRDRGGAIAFIHQDLGLIEWMTVAENIALGQGYPRREGLIDWGATNSRAKACLEVLAGTIDPQDRVQDLSRAEKSLVAIARALSTQARVIVLDEPTASLPQHEVEVLFRVLRSLKARGIAFIYVSHRLDEVFEVSDRVVVMRDGCVVHAGRTHELPADELVQKIVGQAASTQSHRPAAPAGTSTVLSVSNLRSGHVGPISFEVRRGEVVGLVGLRGAGQEMIARVLMGVAPQEAGEIRVGGRTADLSSPGRAMASGIAFVPSDRLGESIAAGMSVQENMFINPAASGRRWFRLRGPRDEASEAMDLGERVRLRPNEPSLAIEALSGGNQQKVVLARWLRIGGDVLLLEEPTAGVDVGAKGEIYRLLSDLVAAGMAVLLVSTDFEEVEAICHRALVLRAGRIVDSLAGANLTLESLVHSTSLAELAADVLETA